MAQEYRIPFNKIGKGHNFKDSTDISSIAYEIAKRSKFILGEEVENFEKKLGARYGGYAIGVANGTDALEILLRLTQTPLSQLGKLVITVQNAGPPPVSAVYRAGFSPMFCDVTKDGLMDPVCLRNILEKYDFPEGQVAAILPVHLYGQAAPMKSIRAVAAQYGIPVIEDAAQAFGSSIDNCYGSFGMGMSFYPTKALGALGDGGAIITHDEFLPSKIREFRAYGRDCRGVNSRLDELQAAFLSRNFNNSLKNLTRRRHLAHIYQKEIRPELLHRVWNERENYHLFTVLVYRREFVMRHMESLGVEPMVHYYHLGGSFCGDGCGTSVSEDLCHRVLSLPLYNSMEEDDVRYVIKALHEAIDAT